MDLRYRIKLLGIPNNVPSPLYGYNMSVITKFYLTSIALKKNHKYIDYNKVMSAVAAVFI